MDRYQSRSNQRMLRTAVTIGVLLAIAYVVGLTLAVQADNSEATIALIGVGGPVVGAAAGVVGALAGARTQADGAHRTARLSVDAQARLKQLELESANRLKKLELDAAANQLRLEATFTWADRLYKDLGEFLTLSKLYGIEETSAQSRTEGLERLKRQQELDTLRDLLRLNPLVEADPALADRVNQTADAVQSTIMGHPHDGPPAGMQLNDLAAAVGRRLLIATGTVHPAE